MRAARHVPVLLALACLASPGFTACDSSDDDSPGSSSAGKGGSAGRAQSGSGGGGSGGGAGRSAAGGSSAGKGAAGTSSAGSSSGGSAGGGGGAGESAGGAGGDAGANGEAGSGASGGGDGEGLSEVGVCGHRGEATVTDTEFSGFEEYFLIGEEGFGSDICVVRFEVTRTGAGPGECPDCEWSHAVVLGEGQVIVDENGVCENSELGFDADEIASIAGSEPAYGYVDEYAGHVSVLMKYDEDRELWDAFGTATYDPEESTLKFERRSGFCNYRP